VHRIEEHAAKLVGRPSQRRAKIGASYVADKQSVPGEYGMRLGIAGVQIVNHDGDRFWSVAWRFERLQADASQFDSVAVVKRSEGVSRFRRGAQIDFCAHAITEFQMPSDKVSVEMSQEYVLDLERVFGGERNVLVGVALRINDGCCPCLLISNNVGSVSQARQIELLEDHCAPSLRNVGIGSIPTRRKSRGADSQHINVSDVVVAVKEHE